MDLESDFVELRLYESADATLDTASVLDLPVGSISSSALTLDTPFTLSLDSPRTPGPGEERHYLVAALVETTATEHDSIWVEFATGDLLTSTGGRGVILANPDTTDVLEIDVIATKLVFSTQPAGSISGIALRVPPVVEAWDDLNFLDTDFDDTVTLTADAPGTLQFHTVVAVGGVARFPNLAYVPTEDEEPFTLAADDEAGGAEADLAVVESSEITSSSVNDPPVVDLPDLTMEEDVTEIRPIGDFVTDVDDEELTIEATSDRLLISVDGGLVTLVPEPDFFGEASLTFTATDAFGAQSSETTTVDVTPVNDPPVLTLPAALTISEDDTLELDLSTSVADPDNEFAALDVLISASPGLSTALDQDTGALQSWTAPDSSGSFTLTVTVNDDAAGTATATVDVTIVAVNDIPRISLPELLTLAASSSTTLALDPYVSDDNPIDRISWTVTPGIGLTASVDSDQRTVAVRAIPGFEGASSLLFVATDAEDGTGSETAEVLVLAPEEEPPTPDPEDPTADFDGSGRVDLDDFFLFSDAFGSTQVSPEWDAAFDLDTSGTVDFDDFFLFADAYGTATTE